MVSRFGEFCTKAKTTLSPTPSQMDDMVKMGVFQGLDNDGDGLVSVSDLLILADSNNDELSKKLAGQTLSTGDLNGDGYSKFFTT